MPKGDKTNTLSKFVAGLQAAAVGVSILENAGIDVDRLIHISNGQGPQSKLVQSTLTLLSQQLAHNFDDSPNLNVGVEVRAAAAPKRKRLPKSTKVK